MLRSRLSVDGDGGFTPLALDGGLESHRGQWVHQEQEKVGRRHGQVERQCSNCFVLRWLWSLAGPALTQSMWTCQVRNSCDRRRHIAVHGTGPVVVLLPRPVQGRQLEGVLDVSAKANQSVRNVSRYTWEWKGTVIERCDFQGGL
jgi:hypothetical protein